MDAVRASLFPRAAMLLATGLLAAAGLTAGLTAALRAAPLDKQRDRPLTRAEATRRARLLEDIGRQLFVDPTLSGSGTLSCASCHSPQHAFGPPNARATQLGGKQLDRVGLRAVPSLRYLQTRPPFSEHFFESEEDGDESVDAGPTGGLTWDGRVNRGRDQARIPLLSPDEMANDRIADIVAAVKRAPYARQFKEPITFDAIVTALATYEQREADFYPYSSKYDASLRGEARLSTQEQRGLQLFNDPAKGNCARCHISQRGPNGTLPQFTDYGFLALGLPRNRTLPANADPAYFDLGLCGPIRTDLLTKAEYCGKFMTPTLRNVATRQTFFHNGVVHSLREAVAFYVQRDTSPEKWYPHGKFDDLPVRYQENVEMEPPFGRRPGDPPALSEAEIDDVVAFLQTLTDGFSAASTPPQTMPSPSPRTGAAPLRSR